MNAWLFSSHRPMEYKHGLIRALYKRTHELVGKHFLHGELDKSTATLRFNWYTPTFTTRCRTNMILTTKASITTTTTYPSKETMQQYKHLEESKIQYCTIQLHFSSTQKWTSTTLTHSPTAYINLNILVVPSTLGYLNIDFVIVQEILHSYKLKRMWMNCQQVL